MVLATGSPLPGVATSLGEAVVYREGRGNGRQNNTLGAVQKNTQS
jgi:hypothetical protein